MDIQVFGFIGALCTSLSFLPQAIKVIKTRDTHSLSLTMYSIFSFGVCMWLVYGLLLMDWPMILANTVTLVFALLILSLKIRNTLKSRKIAKVE